MTLETTQKIVEYNLIGKSKDKLKTKEDDNWLIIRVLIDMGFAKKINNKIFMDCDKIDFMPSFESIPRIRRKLQEDKTNTKIQSSEKTQQKRKKAQVQFKEHYGKRSKFTSDINKNSYLSW